MENFRESNNRANHSSIWKENIWSFQTLNLCRPWFKFKSNHWRIDLSKFELHRAQVQPSWSLSGAPCFSSSSWCSSNLGSSDENTPLQMTLKNWSKFPVNVTLKTSKLCRKVSVLVEKVYAVPHSKRLRTFHLPLLMSFHSMLQAVRSPFYSFR